MQKPKTVVITGTNRGIGQALALKFLELDFTVHGCGRSAKGVQELNARTGKKGIFTQVDVNYPEQISSWASAVLAESGAPDILINNAGVINEHAYFQGISAEVFDRVIQTNVTGTANVLREFLPAMVKARQGLILNMSSGAGLQGFSQISPYCTSKFAIEGLSKSIAQELPEEMACIPLSPGVIDTDLLKVHWGTEPASKCPNPTQWAEYAVPFMLSLGHKQNGQSVRIPNVL